MTTAYEIPLSPNPQQFVISLGGTQYTLTVKFNAISSCWILDIGDVNNNSIATGIPLITGIDLLEQYGYLNFGGQLVVQMDNDLTTVPGYDDLGVNGHLYWIQ